MPPLILVFAHHNLGPCQESTSLLVPCATRVCLPNSVPAMQEWSPLLAISPIGMAKPYGTPRLLLPILSAWLTGSSITAWQVNFHSFSEGIAVFFLAPCSRCDVLVGMASSSLMVI